MNKFWFAGTKIKTCGAGLLLALLLIGAGRGNAQEAPVPVNAVATFSIMGDLVRNVGGDRVNVAVLVGPDADVHTFEPSPRETVDIARSRVIFENGFHFEHWLDKLYVSSASKALRVVVTDGVEPIEAQHGTAVEANPHVWQDVSNVMIMVERIRDGLIAVDEANTDYYTDRAEKYLSELATLDLGLIDTLKDLPEEKRKLVTVHDSFAYFAKRYGFKIVGAGLEASTTEAVDPSAAQMARLADQIKASGVPVVFTENMANPKSIDAIALETQVRVAPPLYADALGPEGSAGDTYVHMMQYNARTLAEHLK